MSRMFTARRPFTAAVAVAVLAASLALLAPGRAEAGAITVTRFDDPPPGACDPGDCSLREAIMAANVAPGANSIDLRAGTYLLAHGPPGGDDALNGDLDVVDALALRGAGRSRTTIDGGGAAFGDRILHLPSGDALTLEGLTLTGAVTSAPGAGIQVDTGGTLSGTDVAVVGTVGGSAPGLNADASTVTLTRSLVAGNTTTTGGCCSGISTSSGGTLRLTDVVVRDNHSPTSCCAGISTSGGAEVHLTRVRAHANTGGSCCTGINTSGGGSITARDVTVSDNVSGSCCAGLSISGDPTASFVNVTVTGNSSTSCCSGLVTDGTTTINGATVVNNVSDSDTDGDCCAGIVASDSTTVSNTIAAGNRAGNTPVDCSGTVTSTGFNLIQAVDGCTIAGDTTGNILGADPRLGPLGDNGGAVPTHALLRGSPAINAGSPAPAGPGGTACEAQDQRGAPRKNCDIGAYELVRCAGTVVNRVGTPQRDVLRGTKGRDGMIGLRGKDRLVGKKGKDALCGGRGKDTLRGGPGKDTLKGGPGKDVCIGGPGKDRAGACKQERSI